MASRRAGVISVALISNSTKLQSEANAASAKLGLLGVAAQSAGRNVGRGMSTGADGVRRLGIEAARSTSTVAQLGATMVHTAEAASALAASHVLAATAMAKYTASAATSSVSTGQLVNDYRALRIVLSPTAFTAASIGVGILVEETIRLVNARAQLIEQQSLFAAKSHLSFQSVDSLDAASNVSGKNGTQVRSLFTDLQSRRVSHNDDVQSGLKTLGVSGSLTDPAILGKIAAGFDAMADPVKRAEAAVQIFGSGAGQALDQLDAQFAKGSSAVAEYGLKLDEISRTQIYQFRKQFVDLKNEIASFGIGFKASFESEKQTVEQFAAALDDMSRKGIESLNNLVADYVPGMAALRALLHGDKPHGDDVFKLPAAPQNDTGATLLAQDLNGQAKAAKDRQSQTLEGQQRKLEEYRSRAEAAGRKLEEDEAKREKIRIEREVNPDVKSSIPVLSTDARFALSLEQQSASALAEVTRARVREMEAVKGTTELLSEKLGGLRTEMRHSAEAADIAGKSEAARREAEATRIVEDAKLEIAKRQVSAATKPGEPILSPTAAQIASAIPADKADELKRAALAELEAADADKAHIRSIEAVKAITELMSGRFSNLRLEMEKAALQISAVGKSEERKRELEAEQFVQDTRVEIARHQVAAATPPGLPVPPPSASQIANAIPADEAARLKQDKLAELTTEAEKAWRVEIDRTVKSIEKRIQVQAVLNAAIGKGIEATKAAAIEGQLIEKFGENYKNPKRQADVSKERELLTSEGQAKDSGELEKRREELLTEIRLETLLTEAQLKGADAVAEVRHAETLRLLEAKGLEDLVELEKVLFETRKKGAENAETKSNLDDQQQKIDQLDLEIEGEKALAEAQLRGAEAVRQQAIENKLALLDYDSASTKVFDTLSARTKSLADQKNQVAVTREALATAQAYTDELESLTKQLAVVTALEAKQGQTRDLEIDRQRIENDIHETLARQALAVGTLSDGYKAFFTTIGQEAEKPGKILYDGMHSAVDRTSDELSKLLTGQKTSWGKAFQDVGQQIVKQTTDSAIKKGLGALSDRFPGLKLPGAPKSAKRPTGNPNDLIHVYDHSKEVGNSGTTSGTGSGGSQVDLGRLFGDGSTGGFIFSLLDKFRPRTATDSESGLPRTGTGELKRLPSGLIDRTGTSGPTGKTGDPVHVIQDQGQSQSDPFSKLLGPAIGKGAGGIGSLFGGLGGLFGGAGEAAGSATESVSSAISFGGEVPGFAAGTDATPVGSAYWVGERGPELEINNQPHSVVPLDKLGGGGGETHIHNYNMPGADIGAAGRLKQAQEQTQQRAVKIAANVISERAKRTTRGSR